ncbi:TIGR01777 family oxidoreductase [Citrobacter sp. JGM124]|uniref:TIGR01777 family oxidoreductase n=1 Tax=Citrobacter sp. JGM124 TaxID=2799789 RepID=UPI001BA648B7|nr:TIGR01777 family oxidoreductase [Citrobacter sp. JGM124]MBS0846809.1 TIGR01777 family oxidoreductase [Citrobacter sp. JGM124]
MRVLITGGTGLIGHHLITRLVKEGARITVLTRFPERAATQLGSQVSLLPDLSLLNHLDDFDAVINLAGEPIVNRRWTTSQKEHLCQSRWHMTEQLVALIRASHCPPEVLISGSAIGYYGDKGEIPLTEDTPPHDEFTHRLCQQWEQIALGAQTARTRVCLLRTGVVLANDGGALKKMLPPFRYGLGGALGNGHQYMAWIHIDDMVNGIIWLLNNPLHGPFNLVSPQPVTNTQFTRTLGNVLNRPTRLSVPGMMVRLLMGEAAVLLLGSQHAIPQRLEASGFQFNWPELHDALQNLLT